MSDETRTGSDYPAPASSDEPARCEHGLTAPHFLPVDQKPVRGGCPGPAASGTPDGER